MSTTQTCFFSFGFGAGFASEGFEPLDGFVVVGVDLLVLALDELADEELTLFLTSSVFSSASLSSFSAFAISSLSPDFFASLSFFSAFFSSFSVFSYKTDFPIEMRELDKGFSLSYGPLSEPHEIIPVPRP